MRNIEIVYLLWKLGKIVGVNWIVYRGYTYREKWVDADKEKIEEKKGFVVSRTGFSFKGLNSVIGNMV